jgi:hypothetical protein
VIQAARSRHKYLHAGIVTLAISSLAAVYLNFEGARCLATLGNRETALPQMAFEEAAEHCFIITNSYVYSLFGVVAGIILVSVWAFRRGKISHFGE